MIDTDAVDRTLELARGALAPTAADRARGRAGLGLRPKRVMEATERVWRSGSSWAALQVSGTLAVGVGILLAAGGFGVGYWTALRQVSPAVIPARSATAAAGEASRARLIEAVGLKEVAAEVEAGVGDVSGDLPAVLPEPALRSESVLRAASSRDREPPLRRNDAPLPRRRPAAPIAPSRTVGDELSLLRRVERALRAEDPALALALLRELDERFPDTTLTEERSAADVLARCTLAEPGARPRAESFLRDRPASVYVDRVRAACQLPSTRATLAPGEGSPRRGHE